MIRVKVENFSCIKHADFSIGYLTVLIGPQASGKSVLSKLAYFFIDLITDQYEYALDQKPFDTFSSEIKNRFSEWFPKEAWGSEKFKIEFEMGEFKLRITRTSYDESVRNNLRLWASDLVKVHYKEASDSIKSARGKLSKRSKANFSGLELGWEVRETGLKVLRDRLGEDFTPNQTFIPAGRSFFTNLGRAFMAFDQARMMDPITMRFGRFYSSFYDHFKYLIKRRSDLIEVDLSALLGGNVIWESERPLLKLDDGRIVPFSAMSSGQQELFPLVVALSGISRFSDDSDFDGSQLVYIEEPEAHLFPSAQSQLLQVLASLVVGQRPRRRLLLTTHSPYVLSKINNLIKAGELAERLNEGAWDLLDRIIPAACWLSSDDVRAYAIIDGELRSIIDEDGLIAADYLDSVSGEIGKEFDQLLDLEFLK